MTYHVPVLLKESIEGLAIKPDGTYVDVTFGGGGHSREIMKNLGDDGRLVGFDQDDDAQKNIIDDKRFLFVDHNFKYIHNFLQYFEVGKVDGILADLGVSSHHFDAAERGFSFRFDADLDMRMNRQADMKASDIVNTYNEADLAKIFFTFGEVKNARKLARAICTGRGQEIKTIEEFKNLIETCIPKHREHTYLAKVFQALRIEVNQEMKALEEFLNGALEFLAPGGRLVVITYHSLEDRMIKNFMRSGNIHGKTEKDFYGNVDTPFELINRKVIVPTDEELERNNRARSAKLRIAGKKQD